VLQLAAGASGVDVFELPPEPHDVPASAATPAEADSSSAWRRLSLVLFPEFDLDTLPPLRARRRPLAVTELYPCRNIGSCDNSVAIAEHRDIEFWQFHAVDVRSCFL
jgi:hypothetical protein